MKASPSSTSSLGRVANREFATSTMEYLLAEIVAYCHRSTDGGEAMSRKLEEIGFDVGSRLSERLTRDRGRLTGETELIKFICKEFWQEFNGKTADGLKTDNKGTFQVQSRLRLLSRLSGGLNVNVKDEAQKYVMLTCGLIRGALDSLGLNVAVRCEIGQLPGCKFLISIQSTQQPPQQQ